VSIHAKASAAKRLRSNGFHGTPDSAFGNALPSHPDFWPGIISGWPVIRGQLPDGAGGKIKHMVAEKYYIDEHQ